MADKRQTMPTRDEDRPGQTDRAGDSDRQPVSITPATGGDGPLPKGRAWQRMLSGRRLDLLDPKPADIEIEDIAHGLARVARWNGQTVGDHAFSVAEHSLLVGDILLRLSPEASRGCQLAALLHDAPEYVIGDLISPFKAAIGMDYKLFELKILEAIFERFGIGEEIDSAQMALIKQADGLAAYYEAVQLAGFSLTEAAAYFSPPMADDARFAGFLPQLEALSVAAAETAFLARFTALESIKRV